MNNKMSFNQSIEDSNLDHINTEVIHPIAINQDTATFNITNRGGSLDKHTTLVLPITCATQPNQNTAGSEELDRQSFLPLNVGIFSCLRSAQLISNGNGVVIAQNDNPALYAALAHSFQNQEFRRKVLKCRHGIFEDYEPALSGSMALGGASADAPGRLTLSNMKFLNKYPQTESASEEPNIAASARGNIHSLDNALNTNYRIKSSGEDSARLYISLEALFPKMYNGLQLPIHMIEAGVSLVLQFSRNGSTPITNERACASALNVAGFTSDNNAGGVLAYTNMNVQILTDEVVLLTDYLVAKDDNQLASQVMSPDGLTLQYGDLLWNNFYLAGLGAAQVAGERNFKRDVFNLGAANQVIRQMYMYFCPTQSNALAANKDMVNDVATAVGAGGQANYAYNKYNSINCLKNIYSSKPLSHLPDGERIQVKINQQNVFNQPLEHNGHKLHELQTAYGASFCKPQCSYEMNDIVLDALDKERYAGSFAGQIFEPKSIVSRTASCQSWSMQNLVGSNHFIGVNLQKPLLAADGSLVRANLPGSGTRCGPTPIQIEIDRLIPCGFADDHRNVFVCLCVEKTLNIKMGTISVVDN